MARREVRFRRSPHLVLYWRGASLIAFNYATAASSRIHPGLCALLDMASEWRTRGELAQTAPIDGNVALRALLDRLVSRQLLQRSDRAEPQAEAAMSAFDPWNPEAGFFHTATRNVRFWERGLATKLSREKARREPIPTVAKRYRGVTPTMLPAVNTSGGFAEAALRRRTWRRFSSRPLATQAVSTLLGLTAGIQQWVRTGGQRLALKTSPSGGARHPIELYVAIRNVDGVRRGLYHYAADVHGLERIAPLPKDARLASYFPSSPYFAKASVLVFLSAVFARQLWRYPYSRAYRAALTEAGHLAQTFCLAAASLHLAPFCLMGLDDARIEEDLGLDGVAEPVLYAMGVGRPPAGASWAPLTRGRLDARPNPALKSRR